MVDKRNRCRNTWINNLFPVLFIFGNVHHAEIALIMMIGRFSPDSGNGKWHTFTTSVHPSF